MNPVSQNGSFLWFDEFTKFSNGKIAIAAIVQLVALTAITFVACLIISKGGHLLSLNALVVPVEILSISLTQATLINIINLIFIILLIKDYLHEDPSAKNSAHILPVKEVYKKCTHTKFLDKIINEPLPGIYSDTYDVPIQDGSYIYALKAKREDTSPHQCWFFTNKQDREALTKQLILNNCFPYGDILQEINQIIASNSILDYIDQKGNYWPCELVYEGKTLYGIIINPINPEEECFFLWNTEQQRTEALAKNGRFAPNNGYINAKPKIRSIV